MNIFSRGRKGDSGGGTKTSRARRILRRAGRVLLVVLLAIIVLLAVLPSVICSGPVERAVTRAASRAAGRPVVFSKLRVGWFTPLSVERVALPAIEGEDLPLFELQGVSCPLTLGRLARLPPYPVSLTIDKIEANIVRSGKGALNTDPIVKTAQSKPKKEKSPAPERVRKPGAKPPVIPLSNLEIVFKRIDARFVDGPKKITAGWENGSIKVTWPGPGKDLSAVIGGDLRINATNAPWEIKATLASWTDPEGRLTPDKIRLTADTGRGENGLLYVNGTGLGGEDSVIKVNVPIAGAASLAKNIPLPAPLPDVAGNIALNLAARHDGGFRNWTVKARLDVPDIKVDGTAAYEAAGGKGFNGTLSTACGSELDAVVRLPATTADGKPAGPIAVEGKLVTGMETAEAQVGEFGAAIAGFSDRRSFTATLNPAEQGRVIYTDSAETRLAAVETTTGIAVNDIFLDAKASFDSAGTAGYRISRAGVSNVVVETPAAGIGVPPVEAGVDVAADLKNSSVELRDGRFSVGDFLSGRFGVDFGWTSMVFGVKADAALRNFSNALAMIKLKDKKAAAAIPALSGAVDLRAGFKGRVPGGKFTPGDPLPASGELVVNLDGIGIDGGEKYRVDGIGGSFSAGISGDGHSVTGALHMAIAAISAGAKKNLPLNGLKLDLAAELREFDRLTADAGLSLAGTRTRCAAGIEIGGLRSCIGEKVKPADLADKLRISATALLEQDLGGFGGLAPGLELEGKAGVSLAFEHVPRRKASVGFGLTADGISLKLSDKFAVENMNGKWSLTKTLEPRETGRLPAAHAPGRITIDALRANTPKMDVVIRKAAIGVSGLERGLDVGISIDDMVGGPTEGRISLAVRNGDPEISGKFTMTGINGDALMPGGGTTGERSDADINAVAEFAWRLPADPEGTPLDHFRLNVKSIRIGRRALIRLLQAADSRQETPQLQGAIAALSLGTPTGVELQLENSLISVRSELLLFGGFRQPLTILDSAPLGDMMSVFKADDSKWQLDKARWALLLLMSGNLDDFEELLAEMPGK